MAKKERKRIKKVFGLSKIKKFIGSMIAVMTLVLISCTSVQAYSFSWSGAIQGEDPLFTATGTADFNISGTTLDILLTNTSTDQLTSIGQSLSVLTWDITNADISLSAVSAVMYTGSQLVGYDATSFPGITDLSSEWGFKEDIAAGNLGSYGVSAVGDILFGADTFGRWDRFDNSTNLFGPDNGNLNGASGAIVGNNVDFTSGGFKNKGPFVQNQMLFAFNIVSTEGATLAYSEITNVNSLFGTDGAALVPEPTTIALLGIGLAGLAGVEVRRRRKKKAVDKS